MQSLIFITVMWWYRVKPSDITLLQGQYWLNFKRGPKPDFIICFYVRAQFLAELRCVRNVTLANLWIKCQQMSAVWK